MFKLRKPSCIRKKTKPKKPKTKNQKPKNTLFFTLLFRYVFCSVSCKKKVYEHLAEMAKSQLEQAANATVRALQAMSVPDENEKGRTQNKSQLSGDQASLSETLGGIVKG